MAKITDDEALLASGDEKTVGRARKEVWSATRGIQSNPTADIHRFSFTGGDKSKMVAGTKVDSGVTAQACTVSDFSVEEISHSGGLIQAGDKNFVFYDYQVKLTDVLEYPSGTLWDVVRVNYNSGTGRNDVVARRQKAS